MSDEDKKVYHDKAASEKVKLGDEFRKNIKSKAMSGAAKKEAKKQANMRHKSLLKEENKNREERQNACKQKYIEVLAKREEKLKELKAKGEIIASEVSGIKVETSITQKLLEEKESLNASLKEKYLVLFKTHRNCDKKV